MTLLNDLTDLVALAREGAYGTVTTFDGTPVLAVPVDVLEAFLSPHTGAARDVTPVEQIWNDLRAHATDEYEDELDHAFQFRDWDTVEALIDSRTAPASNLDVAYRALLRDVRDLHRALTSPEVPLNVAAAGLSTILERHDPKENA